MPWKLQILPLRGWTGLNDSRNEQSLRPTDLSDCANVRVEEGAIVSTKGTVVHGNDLASAVACYGLYDYVKRDGTRYFVRATDVSGNVDLYYDNAGTWTALSAGGDYHASLHCFATWPATDLLLVTNGSGTVEDKFIGTTQSTWGLPVPGVAPSLAEQDDNDTTTSGTANDGTATEPDLLKQAAPASGAMIDGFYGVSYTYYNSSTGEEGDPTDTETVELDAGTSVQGINVELQRDTWWADDTNFDTIRVYRTSSQSTAALAATAGQYLDQEIDANDIKGGAEDINDATTANRVITLVQSDTALIAAGTLRETDNDRPPACKYLTIHKNRVWLAGNSTNPQYLYYSKDGYPESFPPLNFLEVMSSPTGGKPDITGIRAYRDQLYVFTRDQVWILRGSSTADFIWEALPHGIGCVSHHTICGFQNQLMWWSEGGPVIWDGSQFQFPGDGKLDELMRWTSAHADDWAQSGKRKIGDAYWAIEPSRMSFMVSGVKKVGGHIEWWTAFTPRGGSTNTRCLVYDLTRRTWSIRSITAACIGVVEDSNDQDRLFVGDYTQDILEVDRGWNYDGYAIESFAETGWLGVTNAEEQRLHGLKFKVRCSSPATSSTLTVRWYLDGSPHEAGVHTIQIPEEEDRGRPIWLPLGGHCESVKFRFENLATSEDFAIDEVEVHFRTLPPIREMTE